MQKIILTVKRLFTSRCFYLCVFLFRAAKTRNVKFARPRLFVLYSKSKQRSDDFFGGAYFENINIFLVSLWKIEKKIIHTTAAHFTASCTASCAELTFHCSSQLIYVNCDANFVFFLEKKQLFRIPMENKNSLLKYGRVSKRITSWFSLWSEDIRIFFSPPFYHRYYLKLGSCI